MAQLIDKVRRIEQLKLVKERKRKFDKFPKKDKMFFVDMNYNNATKDSDVGQDYDDLCKESEVNLAEVKYI